MRYNFTKDKKGFTLIELIIVIAIIAILASIAIPVFARIHDQAQASVCASNRHNIELMFIVESTPTSDLDMQEYIDTVSTQFYCPIDGTYTADAYNHVICSKHNKDLSAPEPPVLPAPPALPEPPVLSDTPLLGNRNDYTNTVVNSDGTISEEPAKDYVPGSSHSIGDYVIGSDGLIYECIFNRNNSYDPTSSNATYEWRVVGSKDKSVVTVDGTTYRTYKPGTTIIQNGVYYMYAPVNSGDFNHTGSPTLGPSQYPSEWIDLTNVSPDEYVKPQKDTVMYQAYTAYKKGDVVWHGGKLYRAHSNTTATDGRTPTGGAWGWNLIE